MSHFPVPTLVNAYRPSFFEEALRNISFLTQFQRVLRETFPQRYARVKLKTPRACYLALYEECNKRFPMYVIPYLEAKESDFDSEEGEPFSELVPFEVFGINPWEDTITSPAMALVILYSHRAAQGTDDDRSGFSIMDSDALTPFAKQISRWLPDTPRWQLGVYKHPPRGRAWRSPWQNLHDLITRSIGATDNTFVDVDSLQQHEGNMYPEWNRDEIEALAAEWKRAKPILERAQRLADYIDAKPKERLPLLAGALRRDRATLLQITRGNQ